MVRRPLTKEANSATAWCLGARGHRAWDDRRCAWRGEASQGVRSHGVARDFSAQRPLCLASPCMHGGCRVGQIVSRTRTAALYCISCYWCTAARLSRHRYDPGRHYGRHRTAPMRLGPPYRLIVRYQYHNNIAPRQVVSGFLLKGPWPGPHTSR